MLSFHFHSFLCGHFSYFCFPVDDLDLLTLKTIGAMVLDFLGRDSANAKPS